MKKNERAQNWPLNATKFSVEDCCLIQGCKVWVLLLTEEGHGRQREEVMKGFHF